MRFGVSTQLYHGQRLDRVHIDEIAASGFEAVEVVATRSHVDYHDDRYLDDLAGWITAAGLRLHSIHAPMTEGVEHGRWTSPLSHASADEAARRRAVAETVRALGLARRLPAQVVVVHAGLPDEWERTMGPNSRAAARRSIDEIAAAAATVGLRVAVENIPSPLSTPESLVALVEDEIDARGVGTCIDCGHANLMGGAVETIETMSGLIAAAHVHDNHGDRDEHLPPGDGTIPWGAVLQAMAKVGFDGTFIVEVAPNGSAPVEVLARARRACARLDEEVRSWS